MSFINIRGVNCSVFMDDDKGISRKCTDQGPEVLVRFLINYGDWPSFASALRGTVTVSDDGTVDRIPPFKLPWAPRLYCVDVGDEEPLNPNGVGFDGWPSWQLSVVPVTFAALPYQVEDDNSGTRRDLSGLLWTKTTVRVNGEVFQPQAGTYYMAPFPATTPTDEALIGITRPHAEISMTRYMIPVVKLEDAMSLVGIVNDAEITFGDRTFPRGTLLFLGCSFEPRNDPDGFPVYDIEYNFMGNYTVEWNEFYGLDGQWHLINTSKDGSGDPPFAYADFSPLFSTNI